MCCWSSPRALGRVVPLVFQRVVEPGASALLRFFFTCSASLRALWEQWQNQAATQGEEVILDDAVEEIDFFSLASDSSHDSSETSEGAEITPDMQSGEFHIVPSTGGGAGEWYEVLLGAPLLDDPHDWFVHTAAAGGQLDCGVCQQPFIREWSDG